MAEIERTATIECSAPDCGVQHVITSTHTISDDDVLKAARVAGWYAERLSWRANGTLYACPAHSATCEATATDAFEWAKRATAEMNKVRRAWDKSRRKVAAWLRPIVDARRDEL